VALGQHIAATVSSLDLITDRGRVAAVPPDLPKNGQEFLTTRSPRLISSLEFDGFHGVTT
jgi:hypothetical protein